MSIIEESGEIDKETFDNLISKMKSVGSPVKIITEKGTHQIAYCIDKNIVPDVLSERHAENGILNRCIINGKLLYLLNK